jgi:hypothetical protein
VAPAWAGKKGKKFTRTFCIYLILKLFPRKFIVKSSPCFPRELGVLGSPKVSGEAVGGWVVCMGAGKGGKELVEAHGGAQ